MRKRGWRRRKSERYVPKELTALDRGAAIFTCHLDSDNGSLQRDKRAVPIDVRVAGGQALFRARLGSFRAGEINFRGALSSFRENRNPVAQHFRESLNNGQTTAGVCAGSPIS